MIFKRLPRTEESRRTFNTIPDAMELPYLASVQSDSYNWFLTEGIAELFKEINPITDFIGRDLELNLLDHYLDEPKFDEAESKAKKVTYEAPLRVRTELINKRTGEKKEQEFFSHYIPWPEVWLAGKEPTVATSTDTVSPDSPLPIINESN